MFTGCRGRGLRIVYGCLPDVEDEAYGLFTDFYRIWGRRLTDCLRILTGCKGGGLRMVYGFLPDWGRRLTDCLRIFTGCRGRGLPIVYGFVPDLGEEACGLFIDLDRIWGRRLPDCAFWLTDFVRISAGQLTTPGVEKSFGRRR